MKVGTKGTMEFKTGISRVFIAKIQTYPASGMPSDYFFDYEENETNRPLIHPEFGTPFPIPEGLVSTLFTPTEEVSEEETSEIDPATIEFTKRMDNYINTCFNEEDKAQGRKLFAEMERIAGRAYIEKEYLSKLTEDGIILGIGPTNVGADNSVQSTENN